MTNGFLRISSATSSALKNLKLGELNPTLGNFSLLTFEELNPKVHKLQLHSRLGNRM